MMERTFTWEPGGLGPGTATTTLALNRGDLSKVILPLFLIQEMRRWTLMLVETPPGSLGLELGELSHLSV